MEVHQLIKAVSDAGIVGIIFVIWYFDFRRMTALQKMVADLERLIADYHEMARQYNEALQRVSKWIETASQDLRGLAEKMPAVEEVKSLSYIVSEKLTRLEDRFFRPEDPHNV